MLLGTGTFCGAGVVVMKTEFTFGGHGVLIKSRERVVMKRDVAFGEMSCGLTVGSLESHHLGSHPSFVLVGFLSFYLSFFICKVERQ